MRYGYTLRRFDSILKETLQAAESSDATVFHVK